MKKLLKENNELINHNYFRFLLQIITVQEEIRKLGRLETNLYRWKKVLKKMDLVVFEKDNFLYFAKEKEIIKKVKSILNGKQFLKQNKELGYLFGYPNCCINHFIKNIDLMIEEKNFTLKRKTISKHSQNNFPWQMNNFTKFSLTLHHNCSYNCQKSLDLAKKYSHLMKSFNQEIFEKAKSESIGVVIISKENKRHGFLKKAKLNNHKVVVENDNSKKELLNLIDADLKAYQFN
ncbi:MAG: DUF483 domain-containing protein [Patescibacteria group bacterium]